MKTIITTVGISIFENYFRNNKNSVKRSHYEKCKGKPASEWDNLKERIKRLKPSVLEWAKGNENASAEIKTLLKIQNELEDDLEVFLLCTDTILSKLAGEIIKELFNDNQNISVKEEPKIIEELQVNNPEKFQTDGMYNLIKKINKIRKEKKEVYLNISGGYKTIIPYLTIMGQLYDMPIYYIYETKEKLIEIPKLPIEFDFSSIEDNYIAFESLRKEKENLPTINEFKKDLFKDAENEFKKLKDNKIIQEENGKINLTVFGRLLFDRYNELFNSGRYNKQNLISNIVELKLFKHFVKEYGSKAEHSKKIRNYEIDIYIEDDNQIRAIEVKSGTNPPILKNNKEGKASKKTIEYKISEGSFKYLLENNKGKKIILKVYLYSPHRTIHPKIEEKIKKLNNKYPDKIKWFLIELDKNYKTNTHWKINEQRITEIKVS